MAERIIAERLAQLEMMIDSLLAAKMAGLTAKMGMDSMMVVIERISDYL